MKRRVYVAAYVGARKRRVKAVNSCLKSVLLLIIPIGVLTHNFYWYKFLINQLHQNSTSENSRCRFHLTIESSLAAHCTQEREKCFTRRENLIKTASLKLVVKHSQFLNRYLFKSIKIILWIIWPGKGFRKIYKIVIDKLCKHWFLLSIRERMNIFSPH